MPSQGGNGSALKDNKVGNSLRRTSLGGLHPLLDVLKGDMRLVYLWPLVESEAHDSLKLYQQIKPGITGWWGCNGRSNIEYKERLELAYYYVKTVFAVLKRDESK